MEDILYFLEELSVILTVRLVADSKFPEREVIQGWCVLSSWEPVNRIRTR
jgi:hypothetical protein